MADIFELIGKISLDGADEVSGKLSKLGSIAGTVGKGVLAIGGAVAAGSVALVKGVQASYGELQQNLGGSEAVYGEYATNIQKIAEDAFKNMGMSQAEYLATANKMGSLLQGSGIEQKKSLDLATSAMQRASDVASVMGIDMTMAMESITGACKGNFTMMDNLGVAMNATTIEAYALEKGMTNFSWKSATNAEKTALALEMFMDRTSQYANNFARESTETISGSVGLLSAAWQDFMAGLGNPMADMAKLTNNLAQSFGAMIQNLTPIIENIANSLPIVLDSLLTAIGEMLPDLITTFADLMVNVIDGLVAMVPELVPHLLEVLMKTIEALLNNLPAIVNVLISVIVEVINGITAMLPTLVPLVLDVAIQILNALIDNLPLLIESIVALCIGLTQAILDNLPMFIGAVLQILGEIVKVIVVDGIPMLVEAGLEIIGNVEQFFSNLSDSIGLWLAKVIGNVSNFVTNLKNKAVEGGKNLVTNMVNEVKKLPGKMIEIGTNVVKGLANGIKNAASWLMDTIKSFASNVIEGFKEAFDINSPSRVMMGLGNFITQGLGVGIERDDSAEKSIKRKMNGIVAIVNGTRADFEVGSGVGKLIAESPLQKYSLDFNAQIGALSDGFDRLINVVGEHLPNIADNMGRDIVLNGNRLVVGMSRKMDNQLGKLATAKGRGNV